MFRHRFITKLFIQLIKQYDIQNKDQFRNNLMDLENLKVYVQQATGHKNVNSLENYIDIAKSELTNMDNIVDNILKEKNKDSIDKEKQRLLNMLKNKEISTAEYIKKWKVMNKNKFNNIGNNLIKNLSFNFKYIIKKIINKN